MYGESVSQVDIKNTDYNWIENGNGTQGDDSETNSTGLGQ
jgi:hypothetical protein